MKYLLIYLFISSFAFGFQLAVETVNKVETTKSIAWYCAAAAPVCLGAHTAMYLYKD